MTAPWRSVTRVGEAEVHRLDPPQTRKHGPLVAIEYDAYVDFKGLRFWRDARGHGLNTVRANERGYGDEVWWFADGPISVIVKDYGDTYSGIGSTFCGWHGGDGYHLATREEAFEGAVIAARKYAMYELEKAAELHAEARRVLRLVTGTDDR